MTKTAEKLPVAKVHYMQLSELERRIIARNFDDESREAHIKARKIIAKCFSVRVQQITQWICDERDVAKLETGDYIVLSKKSFISKGLS